MKHSVAKAAPRSGEATTANYGWTKPTVGASIDVWGGMLNANFDGIDAVVHSIDAQAGSVTTMNALTIVTRNVIPPLPRVPSGGLMQLIVNGRVFCPVGSSPPFSVTGATITWLSTAWSVMPGDEVIACYN